jgi:hypothetical protein
MRTEAASASEDPDRDRGASFVPVVVGQGAGQRRACVDSTRCARRIRLESNRSRRKSRIGALVDDDATTRPTVQPVRRTAHTVASSEQPSWTVARTAGLQLFGLRAAVLVVRLPATAGRPDAPVTSPRRRAMHASEEKLD